MKRSIIILLHIGFWLCYFLLVGIVLGVYYRSNLHLSDPESSVINAFKSILLFAFAPSLFSFYIFYFFLFPRYLQQKKILLSVVVGFLTSVLVAALGYVMLRYFIETGHVQDMDEGGKYGRSTAPQVILTMTVIGLLSGGVALVLNGFVSWFSELKVKEKLRKKNHEMEMLLVKKQFDPHLLFNTINNIDSLILRDAVAASNYLNKLSDILRFVLYETGTDRILLSKEIEYMEKYVALQKIRTTNENYVQFNVSGAIGSKVIAPMLFIPFIENAFKHTASKKIENAIDIAIRIDDDFIQLKCCNKYDSKSVQQKRGRLGNELIQKRLSLLYPNNHTLDIDNNGEQYCVTLTIRNE